jgi:hypothetical protein
MSRLVAAENTSAATVLPRKVRMVGSLRWNFKLIGTMSVAGAIAVCPV